MKVSARFHFSCLPNLVVTLLFISLVCGSSGVHAIAQRQTAAASAVQPFDATNLYKPVEIGITGVVQAGDDPAYARPDYDDSRWLPVDANRRLHDYFPNSQPSIIWWRLHTRVNPVQIGLALQAYDTSHAFEVFINGQKLFESGRVVSGAKYGTSESQLNPGSRLTFYSDGVIEAQNQKGELFGFERGREISTQPAATIAEAAKQFGQEDDITVISVTRTAVLEPAAA